MWLSLMEMRFQKEENWRILTTSDGLRFCCRVRDYQSRLLKLQRELLRPLSLLRLQ